MTDLAYFRRSPRRSWHRFVTFTRGGQILARCGYRTNEVEWSDDPSLNEKGCERCERLHSDDERTTAAQLNAEDDTVPG